MCHLSLKVLKKISNSRVITLISNNQRMNSKQMQSTGGMSLRSVAASLNLHRHLSVSIQEQIKFYFVEC